MATFIQILCVSMIIPQFALAAAQQTPKLKSLEELRAVCDKLENEARAKLPGPIPSGCWTYTLSFLSSSQKGLTAEFTGDKGIVKFCRDTAKRIEDLQKYTVASRASCEKMGVSSAFAMGKTKKSSQADLFEEVAKGHDQRSKENADCAGMLAPIAKKPSADYGMTPAKVPEAAPGNPPKDSYPAITKSIGDRRNQFDGDSKDIAASWEQHEAKNDCAARAKEFIALDKEGDKFFEQVLHYSSLEGDRVVAQIEKYRLAASGEASNADKVRIKGGTLKVSPVSTAPAVSTVTTSTATYDGGEAD